MVPEIRWKSLLKLIRFVLAPGGDGGGAVAAAGKITPDREQTLNALLDEFQQALEAALWEENFFWPTALSALRSTTTRDMPTLHDRAIVSPGASFRIFI